MRRTAVVVPVLLVLAGGTAQAQGERDDVRLRNRCRQAAHYLEMGPRHPQYESGLSMISYCDVSGGAVLAARWRVVDGTDRRDLGRLTYESRHLRDAGLLGELIPLVQEGSRPQAVRLAMLEVLVSYFEVGAALPAVAGDGRTEARYCILGGYADVAVRAGAVPVTEADRPRILAAVQAVAQTDEDPRMRHAAACTASALQLVRQ